MHTNVKTTNIWILTLTTHYSSSYLLRLLLRVLRYDFTIPLIVLSFYGSLRIRLVYSGKFLSKEIDPYLFLQFKLRVPMNYVTTEFLVTRCTFLTSRFFGGRLSVVPLSSSQDVVVPGLKTVIGLIRSYT